MPVSKEVASKPKGRQVLEALLFIEHGSLQEKKLCKIMGISPQELASYASQLNKQYEDNNSLLRLQKNDSLWQTVSTCPPECKELRTYAKAILKERTKRLQALQLEILAIVAYKQPITKVEIETIRGSKADKQVEELLQEDFIREAGKKASPGSPLLYRTTKKFLRVFSLATLNQLPPLADLKNYSFIKKL